MCVKTSSLPLCKSVKFFLLIGRHPSLPPSHIKQYTIHAQFTLHMINNDIRMNISEYIHKMTTNHSLQQSQFFLSRGNSGRTENNNHKGDKLASATVQWHWLYFCLAWKVCYKNLPRNFPISFEASKWH